MSDKTKKLYIFDHAYSYAGTKRSASSFMKLKKEFNLSSQILPLVTVS